LGDLELYVMPLHVAPVVSYEMLRKGRIERPLGGLDRLNLTDVGGRMVLPWLRRGGRIAVRDASLPYPWSIQLRDDDGEGPDLEAIRSGDSTFRSVIKVTARQGQAALQAVSDLLDGLGRDPLETPYWDLKCWEAFHRETGLTFEDLERTDRETIEALGYQRKDRS